MQRKEFRNKKGEAFSYLSLENLKADQTFIFYHATGFNAETYKILLSNLFIKFEGLINVIGLDQRGHGLSDAESDHKNLSSWECYVEDSLEFIDSIDTKVILSGHSMGGVVAAKSASLRPEKVKGLALLEPVLYSPIRAFRFRLLSKLNLQRKVPLVEGAAKRRKGFESFEDAISSYSGRGAFSTWDRDWIEGYVMGGFLENEEGVALSCHPEWESKTFKVSDMDTWKFLRNIKTNCITFCGELGSTCPSDARNALRKLGTNWEVLEYPGSSHFLPMELSDEIIDRLYEFMSK
ncbi:MAG: alpha/beta hydrolase [Gammaproteobacteria bacterium]